MSVGLVALVPGLILSACVKGREKETGETGNTSETGEVIGGAGYSIDDPFDSYNKGWWEISNGWSNGEPFNVGWREENVRFENGQMILVLNNEGCPSSCSGEDFASGEVRSWDFFGQGLFEVSMQAANEEGVVSAFFLYTGPYFEDPWNEIDVEIPGILVSTGKVQLNFAAHNDGGHEEIVELAVDTSETFHTYGIEWLPGQINWYVDNTLVHSVDGPMPDAAMRIYFNLWTGDDEWLGELNYSEPLEARYDWFRYTPYEAG